MSLFFFHLRYGSELRLAEDGHELPSLHAVRHEAVESARELLSDAARRGKAGSLNLQIEVMDESGRTVLIMPVGHATGTESQN